MFRRLLICTDLQDGFPRFAHCATAFATAGVEQLLFLHCQPIPESQGVPKLDPQEVSQIQANIQNRVPEDAGLEVKVEVQMGKVVDCILNAAKTHQSDLVILGTASKNPLSETLFGSTTRALAQQINIPLMIFRPPTIAMMTVEELSLRCQHLCRSLLLPHDGSEASQYAVQKIQTLAQQAPGTVTHCTICWVMAESGGLMASEAEQAKTAESKLAPAEQLLAQAEIHVERSIRSGSAILAILAAAGDSDISAIAIASNSLGKLVEWTTPSLTGELLRRSWYPVLFLPKR